MQLDAGIEQSRYSHEVRWCLLRCQASNGRKRPLRHCHDREKPPSFLVVRAVLRHREGSRVSKCITAPKNHIPRQQRMDSTCTSYDSFFSPWESLASFFFFLFLLCLVIPLGWAPTGRIDSGRALTIPEVPGSLLLRASQAVAQAHTRSTHF